MLIGTYMKYTGKEEFVADLESTIKRFPEFPPKEKVLEIYHAVADEFENKDLISPENFANHAIYKLALGINYETPEGLEEIRKIKDCEIYLPREQFFLAIIPMKSLLVEPYMMSNYDVLDKNAMMTFKAAADAFSKWFLYNFSKLFREDKELMEQYGFYLSAIIAIERHGGLDALFNK